MKHVVEVTKEFKLVNKDGKLTWIEEGKDMNWAKRIRHEVEMFVEEGFPQHLPENESGESASYVWVPFFEHGGCFGYKLVEFSTSKAVANLRYTTGNQFVASGVDKYVSGTFFDLKKAMNYVEDEILPSDEIEFEFFAIEFFPG